MLSTAARVDQEASVSAPADSLLASADSGAAAEGQGQCGEAARAATEEAEAAAGAEEAAVRAAEDEARASEEAEAAAGAEEAAVRAAEDEAAPPSSRLCPAERAARQQTLYAAWVDPRAKEDIHTWLAFNERVEGRACCELKRNNYM
jgi:hypothetical protein